MARTPRTEQILQAAQVWQTDCLVNDGSIFSDDEIWTAGMLGELETYYVDRLDFGDGDFLEKFRQQLEACSPNAKRLAAEMLWVMLLFPSNISKQRKVEVVRTVWGWSGRDLPDDHTALAALGTGIGSGGVAYNNYRWLELVFFIRWVQAWKGNDTTAREELLADPWRFAAWLDALPGADKRQLRHMVLHLLFPDVFERVSSGNNKKLIEKGFKDRLPGIQLSQEESDPSLLGRDRRLLRIRKMLEEENPGRYVDFYEGEFLDHWKQDLLESTEQVVAESPSDQSHYLSYALLPSTSREAVLVALREFDSSQRGRGEWKNWESSHSHRYAVSYEGRLYPVKQIVSMVTGVPRIEFNGGEPSNRYLRQYGFDVIRLRNDGSRKAWIFQANADRYDIDSALKSLAEMRWLVKQQRAEIHLGDRVFLWKSGPTGGIVAKARVSAEPAVSEQTPEEIKYWTTQGDTENLNELRATIVIEEVLSSPVTRREIQLNADLADLSILKFSQGTNFPVTEKEAAVLEVMTQQRATIPPAGAAYWCIAPGEGARLWPEFLESRIMAIGWDDLGDLSNLSSKDDIIAALKVLKASETEPTNDALACYQFANTIRVGDIVIAKRGIKEIIGYGVVTSDYEFRPDRAEYRHVRDVNWIATGTWTLPANLQLPMKTLTDVSDYKKLLDWLLPQVSGTVVIQPVVKKSFEPFGIDEALTGLFMDRESFVSILDTLGRKKNVILQGPPGVGKTFIAKRIAYSLIGERNPDRVEMVQFHQSYSYEDFVQGWRPAQTGFELKNGVFYNFCRKAAEAASDVPFVFVIDEINRANLSKVLGELMMLIEADKRGSEFAIPLTYSKNDTDRFSVPPNVHIVGLMNTADRSLAMVDYALRRRFAFIDLEPAFQTTAFRAYLKSRDASDELVDLIVARLTRLNDVIVNDSKNLGRGFEIGHSFFCPADTEVQLDKKWYRHVIDSEVKPLLHEYWFDDRSKADDWVNQLAP